MPFPYLSPLPPWIVEIMEQRENVPNMSMFKNPWVVMTSGAIVAKGNNITDSNKRIEELKELIKKPPSDSYSGCIISNNSNNLELSYSLSNSPVGIDFNGKVITVENEERKKVSTPLIQSLDIDTDGANNTLKTARVSVKCFTLKQLEMFELFFLKPGMNVLIEFGDSTLLKSALFPSTNSNATTSLQKSRKKYNTLMNGNPIEIKTYNNVTEAMVQKTDFKSFCEKFSDYYRANSNGALEYSTKIEQTLGTYDLIAGKVLDYSFSIADDGTYDVQLEVSQGNQVSLAIPHTSKKPKTKEKVQPKSDDVDFTDYNQILELIISDLNLGTGTEFKKMLTAEHPNGKSGDWNSEFFNFLKKNDNQKDTTASADAYVSVRFILSILMNYAITGGNNDSDFFKFVLPTYYLESGKGNYTPIQILPVNSNKYIMSSDDDLIFPHSELPKLKAPIKQDEKQQGAGGTTEVKKEDNQLVFEQKAIDGTINGYDFHINKNVFALLENSKYESIKSESQNSDRVGDALNIFVKYETVVRYWNSAKTRIEFLEKILDLLNGNSYGLFTLIYGLQRTNGRPTVIDAKFTNISKYMADQQSNFENVYRFKPTTLRSNVKQFSFNFEMSNLVAGRQIFNSGKLLAEAKQQNKNVDAGEIQLPASVYKAFDNSTMGNADGYYSINNVELLKIEKTLSDLVARQKADTSASGSIPAQKESTVEAIDLSEVINNKSIKFLNAKNPNEKEIRTLIFKDEGFIYKYIYDIKEIEKVKKPTLSPIDITLTIDGFSGFTPGQCFKVDGIPEIYNQIGIFQITNIKHNLSENNWDTVVEASFRVVK